MREVFAAAAANYGRGNPLLILERAETQSLLPPLIGRDVLDLGAGKAHYAAFARAQQARLAVALDFTPQMLAGSSLPSVVGDAYRLPFRPASLDVVVAALVLSYVSDRREMLEEIARVLRPGGCLVLSDLHPVASERGWSRSFVGPTGEYLVVLAEPPTLAELSAGLRAAGLAVEVQVEPVIDERLEPEFRRAGRRDFQSLRGTPLLVVLRARKTGYSARARPIRGSSSA